MIHVHIFLQIHGSDVYGAVGLEKYLSLLPNQFNFKSSQLGFLLLT